MADEEVLDQTEAGQAEGGTDAAEEPSFEQKLKEAVEVRAEDIGGLRKKLTITVPRDTISERLDNQYSELRRDAMVPGFRRGRAPRRLLEKRFGNEVSETLVQQMISSGYLAAIDKIELKVIGDPLIFVKEKDAETESLVEVQKAIDIIELPPEGPLTFSCEVEVRPEFELPSIESIPVQKPIVKVSDEDVETHLERMRARRGTFEAVVDGEVEDDDVLLVNIKMTSEGTVLKEEDAVRMAARPQHVDGVLLENLGEQLAGSKVGDTRKVSGTISDDYAKVEFRGKTADFEITVREIQRLKLPELNEELIRWWGFESEQEVRDFLRKELESRIGEEVKRGMRGQVQKYLMDKTSFDLPERLSERQTARVVARRMVDLYRQGMPAAEIDKMMDQVRMGAREETIRDLKQAFIMEKLAETIEVEVSEGEINSQIAAIAQYQNSRFDRVRDRLIKEGGVESLYLHVRDEKILDQVLEKASVTETEPEPAAPAKKAGAKKKSGGKKNTKDKSGEEFADET